MHRQPMGLWKRRSLAVRVTWERASSLPQILTHLSGLFRLAYQPDTPRRFAPPLFLEGTQSTGLEIPSRKRGARQGGVCWAWCESHSYFRQSITRLSIGPYGSGRSLLRSHYKPVSLHHTAEPAHQSVFRHHRQKGMLPPLGILLHLLAGADNVRGLQV